MKPLKSEVYDSLKFFTQIILPALGTLYFALAGIWGLPAAEQIVGTIVAIDTFLGVVLQLSSSAYAKTDENFDGSLDIEELRDGTKNFLLNLDGDHEKLGEKEVIRFKVNPPERNA